ncbi:MAG TPA: YcaO-like family protein [Sandaracinaceae bacterium]
MDELERLTRAHPLPERYGRPQLYQDEVVIGGSRVRRAGIVSTAPDGRELTGSAAELGGSPVERAYFELLERAAILEARGRTYGLRDEQGRSVGTTAGERCDEEEGAVRLARSNGVALHRTWTEACRRARYELVERDRVLRSWYGELPLADVTPPRFLRAFDTHEWRACSIADEDSATRDVHVVAVVGLPRRADLPLARGFAGGASPAEALAAAAREALQGLAFLWGEPLPASAPMPAPSPMFHLDYYLLPSNHAHIRRWLDGGHYGGRGARRALAPVRYADLTPERWRGSLWVVRAVCADARPLVFGRAECRAPGLPGSEVHPIP